MNSSSCKKETQSLFGLYKWMFRYPLIDCIKIKCLIFAFYYLNFDFCFVLFYSLINKSSALRLSSIKPSSKIVSFMNGICLDQAFSGNGGVLIWIWKQNKKEEEKTQLKLSEILILISRIILLKNKFIFTLRCCSNLCFSHSKSLNRRRTLNSFEANIGKVVFFRNLNWWIFEMGLEFFELP